MHGTSYPPEPRSRTMDRKCQPLARRPYKGTGNPNPNRHPLSAPQRLCASSSEFLARRRGDAESRRPRTKTAQGDADRTKGTGNPNQHPFQRLSASARVFPSLESRFSGHGGSRRRGRSRQPGKGIAWNHQGPCQEHARRPRIHRHEDPVEISRPERLQPRDVRHRRGAGLRPQGRFQLEPVFVRMDQEHRLAEGARAVGEGFQEQARTPRGRSSGSPGRRTPRPAPRRPAPRRTSPGSTPHPPRHAPAIPPPPRGSPVDRCWNCRPHGRSRTRCRRGSSGRSPRTRRTPAPGAA